MWMCLLVSAWVLTIGSAAFAQPTADDTKGPVQSTTPERPSDIPVQETEPERAEAKEAEAKKEALESLFVRGKYTLIPLPAFTYNRNERYWIGALMPILKSNDKGELQDIIAPQYLHNPSIGETVTLNYFGYPSDTEQYSAVLSYSTKIQRDIDLNYKNVGAGGGRYLLAGQVTWFKNAFRRFFGIGNETPESNETNYTSRETLVQVTAGINLNPDIAVMWTERYHDVRTEVGGVTSLPQAKFLFPNLFGMQGAQIFGHKLTFRYDTRDKQLIPTRGTYVTASVELNQNIEHKQPDRWLRTTIDAHHLIPHVGDRMVFVAHFLADTVNGHAVPFYERPTLGGENTLRAFGQSRFIDDTALLINFEERIRVREQKVFDYLIDFEIAPFVDIGRVMSRFRLRDLDSTQVNPGIGLRVLAKPHVVGRFDLAYGQDGTNVFVGLDYPF